MTTSVRACLATEQQHSPLSRMVKFSSIRTDNTPIGEDRDRALSNLTGKRFEQKNVADLPANQSVAYWQLLVDNVLAPWHASGNG